MAVKITSIFLVCILTTLSTLAVGKKLSFKKCGGYSDIESVDIPSCSSDPCVLEVGSTINASMSFTPSEMVEKGTIKVFVLAFGLRVPFPYPDNDVCKNHGLVCPLKSEKQYDAKMSLYLKDIFPHFHLKKAKAEIMAKDQSLKTIFCFQIDVIFKYKWIRSSFLWTSVNWRRLTKIFSLILKYCNNKQCTNYIPGLLIREENIRLLNQTFSFPAGIPRDYNMRCENATVFFKFCFPFDLFCSSAWFLCCWWSLH